MIPAIIIAEDGTEIQQGEFKYDTRKKHLPIDLEGNPRHYDVVEMAGGTALHIPAGDFSVHQETLLTIPHKLGYTPFAFAYFYVISKNGNTVSPPATDYQPDFYAFSGGSSTYVDSLTFKADSTNFRIVHYIVDTLFGDAHTSDADDYQFRIKFYIASIDTGLTGYSGDRLAYI